ncbi:beta-lactamase family protein [Halomonas sp. M5N1S17]|uniref:serine hydrolase domain-containing protein n=1 Tax=Halomonas alkalisoli TaxID=2907158 RepID=UPI001F24EFD2|nr:serine hydrolase [Halomonas alkalisoli]MCE9666092.1 beta-lactamase family protein [Halomonas alkalisoli]
MTTVATRRRLPKRYPILLTIMLALTATCHSLASEADFQPLYQSALQRLESEAGDISRLHSLVVAEEGEIVFERTYAGPGSDRPVNIKSLSKTVLAALVGAAIEQGVIEGVDQPVVDLLGPLAPNDIDPRVEDITVGHLLSLQAGLERTSGANYGAWVASDNWVAYALRRPFVDRPGGRMLYSTGSSHLLSAALAQASGDSTLSLARQLLGDPLNITIPDWPRDPQGIHFGGNDMQLSPLALIQVGELYRLDGVIDGRRVLPEGWVEASWTPRGTSPWTSDGYGYGWFVTRLGGEQAYYGRGYGGQALYVIPDRKLTIAITADPLPPSPGGSFQHRLNRLVDTLVSDKDER